MILDDGPLLTHVCLFKMSIRDNETNEHAYNLWVLSAGFPGDKCYHSRGHIIAGELN